MQFRGEYYFLSNMSPAKIKVSINGREFEFDNAEAAFQAAKCPEKADQFVSLSGYQAKKLGRRMPLRPDWDDFKLEWMLTVLNIKFHSQRFKEKLLATGDMELIEDNTWNDTYWGMCNGVGENHLGKILMKIREILKAEI